jgi:Predicted permeases
MEITELTASTWGILAAAAFVMGMSKGGIPGIAVAAIPWVAMTVPGKASTGLILPMLIIGDLFALAWFRRSASIKDVLRALPWAVLGVFAGWWLLGKIPDDNPKIMNRIVGVIILFILTLQIGKKLIALKKPRDATPANPVRSGANDSPTAHIYAMFMGAFGGITTTLANAAGPVMSAYFLGLKLPKATFIGTSAWFFFIINWIKVPIMVKEKMISLESLRVNLYLIPALLLGVFAGIAIVKRINQATFEWVVTIIAALASLKLVI